MVGWNGAKTPGACPAMTPDLPRIGRQTMLETSHRFQVRSHHLRCMMAQPSRSALFLGFALLIAGPTLATTVGGDIVTDTTWDAVGSPYEVVSTVVVRSGATLTIDPGVTVQVNELCHIFLEED